VQLIRKDNLSPNQATEVPPAEHLTNIKIAGCQYGLIITPYFIIINAYVFSVIETAVADDIFSSCELHTGSFFKRSDHSGHVVDELRTISLAFKKRDT
jgi:hypothetical protein